MRKLTKSERLVIERLIFPESFEVLLEETNMPFGSLRDDIMNLVNYRFVEVVDLDKAEENGVSFYDTDNIREFSFRATKTGLKSIRQPAT